MFSKWNFQTKNFHCDKAFGSGWNLNSFENKISFFLNVLIQKSNESF